MKKLYVGMALMTIGKTLLSILFGIAVILLFFHFSGIGNPFASSNETKQTIAAGRAELDAREAATEKKYQSVQQTVDEQSAALQADINSKFEAHRNGEYVSNSSSQEQNWEEWMEEASSIVEDMIQ